MDLVKRKPQRLKKYDYSQNGAYFITICTQNKLHLFGKIKDRKLILNQAGEMVSKKFAEIPDYYPVLSIDKFIVMPNHLHAIIILMRKETFQGDGGTAQGPFPTVMGLSDYIHRFKTLTTKLYIEGVRNNNYTPFDKKVWQKSYYDHIIRNEQDYQDIWEYIDTNPLKWESDQYY